MKLAYIWVFLFGFVAGLTLGVKAEEIQLGYIPTKDVVEQFKYYKDKPKIFKVKGKAVEPLNKQAQKRKLINSSDFISSDMQKALRRIDQKALAPKLHGKGSVDLRSRDTAIVSQFGGTCTAHGLAAAIENYVGNPDIVNLSERHVWSGYRLYSCEAAIKAWSGKDRCITLAEKWPNNKTYPIKGYLDSKYCFSYLVKTTYIGNDLQKMIDALDANHPGYLGVTVSRSMMNCDSTLNPQSIATRGGHAIAIVGYKLDDKVLGGGYFIIKNSWGSDCGDEGYQYLPFQYCQRSDMYCIIWTIDEVKDSIVSKHTNKGNLKWKTK